MNYFRNNTASKLRRPMTNIIRELRKSKNISIDRLAELVGGSIGTLHRLETGQTNLYHELLPELSRVLNCPILVLAGLERREDAEESDKEVDADVLPYSEEGKSSQNYGKQRRIELGEGMTVWRVLGDRLDAMGIEPGDLIASVDAKGQPPIIGDPVIIKVKPLGESKSSGQRLLLRQYIEPDLFITNSRTNNGKIINRSVERVEVVGTVATKVFRN